MCSWRLPLCSVSRTPVSSTHGNRLGVNRLDLQFPTPLQSYPACCFWTLGEQQRATAPISRTLRPRLPLARPPRRRLRDTHAVFFFVEMCWPRFRGGRCSGSGQQQHGEPGWSASAAGGAEWASVAGAPRPDLEGHEPKDYRPHQDASLSLDQFQTRGESSRCMYALQLGVKQCEHKTRAWKVIIICVTTWFIEKVLSYFV